MIRRALGATYRVQLRAEFGFAEVEEILDYLLELGVECLYVSPVLEAVPASTHGYDGIDPGAVRAELGGRAGLDALCAGLRARGLGLVLDIVPNHLSTDPRGPWWRDVLAHGRDSRFAEVFDVDWSIGPVPGQVTVPMLDRPLADAIAAGLVRLEEDDGAAVLRVGSATLPLSGERATWGASLEEILGVQHYRLVDWHDRRDRNYRRFFDIDSLIGVRVEQESVFSATHALIAELCTNPVVAALRVDHLDGLADPAGYLARLAELTDGVPVIVEKILTGDEVLDRPWPVLGTTGYEAIDDIDGALVDPDGLEALRRAGEAAGDEAVGAAIDRGRAEVIATSFPAELDRLAAAFGVAPGRLDRLVRSMPVYRTYGGEPAGMLDAAAGDDAALLATVRAPEHRHNLERLEQLCTAVMAKGVEDTAWYRLVGPLAFCEVGGDPARTRSGGPERLVRRAESRRRDGHAGLVPGSTHDTKRSADVRARLLALASFVPSFEHGLSALCAELDPNGRSARELRLITEMILSSLPAGGPPGPDYRDRLVGAALKSAREEGRSTSWLSPEPDYEARLVALVDDLVADDARRVLEHLGSTVHGVQRAGMALSLAMVVLRSVLPGVPDCYQGDETVDLSLVDPDNRRLVDHRALAGILAGLRAPGPGTPVAQLGRSWADGRAKLHCTQTLLHLRATRPDLFSASAPLGAVHVEGPGASAVLALERGGGALVAVVAREPTRLCDPGDDRVAGADFRGLRAVLGRDSTYDEVLSGSTHRAEPMLCLEQVCAHLPVGVLVRR